MYAAYEIIKLIFQNIKVTLPFSKEFTQERNLAIVPPKLESHILSAI